MRIAFLCKRRYMSKDVILDRYARLYEIPYQLARLGHAVEGFCLAYQARDGQGDWSHNAAPGSLEWHGRSVGRLLLPGMLGYPFQLLRQLRAFNPDVVIAASDIPHVVMGSWLSKKLRKPFVADLYDNFEGFGQARIPGMASMFRRAVRGAELVLTTSEPLRDLVRDDYQARGEVVAMPSSVDKLVFHPRDKVACRRALGLPADAQLVGTAGALYKDKGITELYAAWQLVQGSHPGVHLVLAGPTEEATPLPKGERVHYLGSLPHQRVAELFCALDVGAICIPDTPFGRYSFPQKAYEMLACGLPIVASSIGAMQSLFASTPQSLFDVGDTQRFVAAISAQLLHPTLPNVPINDWAQLIAAIEPKLRELANAR